MARLSNDEIQERLCERNGWSQQSDAINRTFQFKDFVEAMHFVNQVAKLAETACHHPDIDIRWNKVTLALSTHSEGGLTNKDFKLAESIDQLLG